MDQCKAAKVGGGCGTSDHQPRSEGPETDRRSIPLSTTAFNPEDRRANLLKSKPFGGSPRPSRPETGHSCWLWLRLSWR